MALPSTDRIKEILLKEAKSAAEGFLTSGENVNLSSFDFKREFEEIVGPGIEVVGSEFNYSCVLEYDAEANENILNLIFSRFPGFDESELPEIDILDALGEFLNILCGKINLCLEKDCPDLNIEVPYFVYGLEPKEDNKDKVLSFSLSSTELAFNLYFYWS